MTWIHSRLSFANVISVIALFVAMGGTSVAAIQLTKNSVGSKQIKKNAVKAADIAAGAVRAPDIRAKAVNGAKIADGAVTGADLADNGVGGADIADDGVGGADIADNAVGSADIADNAVGGAEVAANAVGGGEIADNAVGSGEVTNDSLTAADILGSSLDGEVGPDLFARVQADGTLQPDVAGFPSQVKGVDAGDIVKGEGGAATGTYCFGDLGEGRIRNALVTLDNADAAAADRNLVASVAIDRGEDLGDCPATHNQVRVRIVDGNTGAAQDARFFISFER